MLLLETILSLNTSTRLLTLASLASLFYQAALAQTYSKCDPITQSGCPPDRALGDSTSIDFRSGTSNQFTTVGSPTYTSEGVSFTISESGDSPELISNWYIMFGKYEITMQAAPGQGIVSSVVLQSDDLDEIDWEWIGSESSEGQTNYFGKGQTTSWDRGGTSYVRDSHEWHTYGVEWTESQITWSIDGSIVRTLNANEAQGQFPQTPCQLKMGAWSGGDPSNPPGTITWAGGPTDYAAGPYSMVVQSVEIVDYSTGTQYTYGGASGAWTSIRSSGGRVNGNVGGSLKSSAASSPTSSSVPSGAVVRTSGAAHASASFSSVPVMNQAGPGAAVPVSALIAFSICGSLVTGALLGSLNILG